VRTEKHHRPSFGDAGVLAISAARPSRPRGISQNTIKSARSVNLQRSRKPPENSRNRIRIFRSVFGFDCFPDSRNDFPGGPRNQDFPVFSPVSREFTVEKGSRQTTPPTNFFNKLVTSENSPATNLSSRHRCWALANRAIASAMVLLATLTMNAPSLASTCQGPSP
jgi:hypothetical protein